MGAVKIPHVFQIKIPSGLAHRGSLCGVFILKGLCKPITSFLYKLPAMDLKIIIYSRSVLTTFYSFVHLYHQLLHSHLDLLYCKCMAGATIIIVHHVFIVRSQYLLYFIHSMLFTRIGYYRQIWFDYRLSFAKGIFTSPAHVLLEKRACGKSKQKYQVDAMAKALWNRSFKKFWQNIRQSKKSWLPTTVGGETRNEAVIVMWKKQFASLLNSPKNIEFGNCQTKYNLTS